MSAFQSRCSCLSFLNSQSDGVIERLPTDLHLFTSRMFACRFGLKAARGEEIAPKALFRLSARRTCARQVAAMTGDKMNPAPRPEFLPLPRLAKKDMHDIGLCVPCLFYTMKSDGCRKGDTCSHCHFCTREEAKARRRVLRAQGMKKHDIDVVEEDCGLGGTHFLQESTS